MSERRMKVAKDGSLKDFREGVIYVTSTGVAFKKDDLLKVRDVFLGAGEAVYKVIKEAWDFIQEVFRRITDSFGGVKGMARFAEDVIRLSRKESRIGWHIPRSTEVPSQVLSRKPLISNIRNRI